MLCIEAGHRRLKDRLEKRPANRIDLVEHRLAARKHSKNGQRAGPGRRFEESFAGADGGGAYCQTRIR